MDLFDAVGHEFAGSWVAWTLLAAAMQSVRTAGQKHLTANVTPLAATLVRYLFGLPFAFLWLAYLIAGSERLIPDTNLEFVVCASIAGVLQIFATVLLIQLFQLRNFAVGSTWVRSEILLTALIGTVFFAEQISLIGWMAMLVCVAGLISINLAKTGKLAGVWDQSALLGLGSGLCFALTSLFLRQASLSFGLSDATFTAALTLIYMVTFQTAICLVWVRVQQPGQISRVFANWKASTFIGVTGVAGSVGWFTGMTLISASYVKTLGQIELVFSVLLSVAFFREYPKPLEYLGMGLVMAGAVTLLLA